MNIYHFLGQNIRSERTGRGWTQEDLAERASLSQNFIGQIERGTKKASLETVEKIAKALEIAPARLFNPAPYAAPRKDALTRRIASLVKDRPATDKKKLLRIARIVFNRKVRP